MNRPCVFWLGVAITVSLTIPVSAQVSFEFADASSERGIGPYVFAEGIGSGVAAADFDDDGDIDLFIPNGQGAADQLYRNLGDGTFEEIASAAGLASTENNQGALWFDYDADGDLDLFVTNSDPKAPTSYRIYGQSSEAVFEEVTDRAGVSGGNGVQRGGSCAGDINRDGYLDLLTLPWGGEASLFLNNQDGTFTDISESSGVGEITLGYWQPMMADFNDDGWLDIYAAVDFAQNQLWINRKNNTFQERAESCGAANLMNDMGMALQDYDTDGDLDIYCTNIFGAPGDGRNILLRNDSVGNDLLFTEVSYTTGVADGSWGWGCTFMDADNDGWVDLAATNGYTGPPFDTDSSRFFRNLGGDPPEYDDVSAAVGFDDIYWGSGLVSFDADRDGDLDLLQICADGYARLLENRLVHGPATSYLVIQPRMDGPNGFAIGSIVRTRVGPANQTRMVSAGTSFLSQEPAEVFFGLGSTTLVDEVTVEWPDGTATTLFDVCANQVLRVNPGDTAPNPFVTSLTASGPSTAAENAVFNCSAVSTRCDGTTLEVTSDALWEITAGQSYAVLIAPGTVSVGELSGNQTLTLRAEFDGFEAFLSLIAVDSDGADVDLPPVLTVTSPSGGGHFATDEAHIEVTGTATDDSGLASVSWFNDRGGSGPCVGLSTWSTGSIALATGDNAIAIVAIDTQSNEASLHIVVTRTSSDVIESDPPLPEDTEVPESTIIEPPVDPSTPEGESPSEVTPPTDPMDPSDETSELNPVAISSNDPLSTDADDPASDESSEVDESVSESSAALPSRRGSASAACGIITIMELLSGLFALNLIRRKR